jgi:hypothetical protein
VYTGVSTHDQYDAYLLLFGFWLTVTLGYAAAGWLTQEV